MSLKHVLAVVVGAANGAFEGPIPKVATLVVKHISLSSEALTTTLWTRKGPLVLVDSIVNLEVLFLTKGLITAREWTLEGLCPIMEMHVALKAILSSISLIAAWMLADKKLRHLH